MQGEFTLSVLAGEGGAAVEEFEAVIGRFALDAKRSV